MSTDHHERDQMETIYLERARCPRCGWADLLTIRSYADQGDDSVMHRKQCKGKDCGHKFKIVWE